MNTILIAAAAALTVLGAIIYMRLSAMKLRSVVRDRTMVSIEEIYRENYSKSGINLTIFSAHWRAIAKALGENAEHIRPSDRFSVELASRGASDDSNDSLLEYAHGILGQDFRPESVSTVDQLIRQLCSATSQHDA